MQNRSSAYKGLTLVKGKWLVRIGSAYIGIFQDETEAAAAFDAACRLRGHARNLNFPDADSRSPQGGDDRKSDVSNPVHRRLRRSCAILVRPISRKNP